MKVRTTIWTLAWDTRSGTNCKAFASEAELESHMVQILRDEMSVMVCNEADEIGVILNAGRLWEAWEVWCEKFKTPLDTYNWDSQPIDLDLPLLASQ